eukprot:Clim_evm13s231 gene=Clim_evmTU13s231
MSSQKERTPIAPWRYMLAGGVAGLCVDVALFPLDTIKTRLQSERGFYKSGGFKGIYSGLLSAAVGSVPGAAAFFGGYESSKRVFSERFGPGGLPFAHMAAASVGEAFACVVRVPTENVKQKLQAGVSASNRHAIQGILEKEGPLGFFKGYTTTLMREIPFSMIQFPLYEALKTNWAESKGRDLSPLEASLCGSVSGGFAAYTTTPLDVAKTRIMLSHEANRGLLVTIGEVYSKGGITGLFAGATPRTFWISIGGLVFFGAYEQGKHFLGIRVADANV